MKKILILLFFFVSLTSFGQLKKIDTTEICLPYRVGKQIMLDLNRLDSTTAILKLTNLEVKELTKKVSDQQGIMINLEDKIKMNDSIVKMTNEKFDIVDKINKDLVDDNKKLKRKNVIIEIVSGILIGALTYEVITQ
jgi:hypothetical protein